MIGGRENRRSNMMFEKEGTRSWLDFVKKEIFFWTLKKSSNRGFGVKVSRESRIKCFEYEISDSRLSSTLNTTTNNNRRTIRR